MLPPAEGEQETVPAENSPVENDPTEEVKAASQDYENILDELEVEERTEEPISTWHLFK